VGVKFLNKADTKQKHLGMRFVEKLIIESQIRGKHATGFSWTDGGSIQTEKKPLPAKEMLANSQWWETLMEIPPKALIAHTRYSTSGDWSDNKNNMPLVMNCGLAMVHNGLVSQATPEEYGPKYDVKVATANDSEVILRKVSNAIKLSTTTAEGIGEGLGNIHSIEPPIFALGFLEAESEQVYCVRDHIRPLWIWMSQSCNAIGFASTKDIILRAAKASGVGKVTCIQCQPYTVYRLSAKMFKDDLALSFDYPTEERFHRPKLATFPGLASPMGPQTGRIVDGRRDMRKSFLDYYAATVSSWEIDPSYLLLNYLFKRYELSKSQEYWWCWLYGVFYHPGSVFFVAQEFPEFEKVDVGRLQRWHDANWQKLRYNTDRKYEKGHLVEMFVSYRDAIGSQDSEAQERFFASLLDSDDPVKNFHSVFRRLSQLVRFGRYSTYIYTEALHRCMGMPIQADTVFLKDAASPRAGLCYAIGKPEWAKGALMPAEWECLHDSLEELMDDIKQTTPGVTLDYWFVESCLCGFKGFMRPTKGRYIGYYIDRMADEISQLMTDSPASSEMVSGIDWMVLWQFRKECLPGEYLGEYCKPKRLAVHKPWEHLFRDEGKMIGLEPMRARGVLK
jgi:predicted glutamine amidotransferase